MSSFENPSEGNILDNFLDSKFNLGSYKTRAKSLIWMIADTLNIDVSIDYLEGIFNFVTNGHAKRFLIDCSEDDERLIKVLEVIHNFIKLGNLELPSKDTIFQIISDGNGKGKPHCSSAYGRKKDPDMKIRSGPRPARKHRHPHLSVYSTKPYTEQ